MPVFPIMMLVAAAFWGSVLYLAVRFVRATERRAISHREMEALGVRVSQLEEDLAAAHTDIERLAVEGRFTAQLLSARSVPGLPAT